MDFREFGLLGIIILWTAIIYMLRRWRGDRTMSVSMHAASARPAYFLSGTIQTVTGVLLYLFMTQWFVPYFQLPAQVTLVYALGATLQILAAWVPDSKGFNRTFHRFCAFGMATLMPVVVFQILAFAGLILPTVILGGLVFVYMVASALLFIFIKPVRKHFLYYQLAYVAGFHLFILSAAYL